VLALALAAVYAGPWLARRLAAAPAAAAAPLPGPASTAALPAAADGRARGPAGGPLPPLAGRLAVLPLFVLALLRTAAVSFSPFLYFQF
jgi:hypothetical protein